MTTSEQIDAYIAGRVDFPEDPDGLAAVLIACTPEQKAKLRRRISIEMSWHDFGELWFKANNRANWPE